MEVGEGRANLAGTTRPVPRVSSGANKGTSLVCGLKEAIAAVVVVIIIFLSIAIVFHKDVVDTVLAADGVQVTIASESAARECDGRIYSPSESSRERDNASPMTF